jgi:hypothetical protein
VLSNGYRLKFYIRDTSLRPKTPKGKTLGFCTQSRLGIATRPKSVLHKGSFAHIQHMQHRTRFLYLVALGIATRPKSVLHKGSLVWQLQTWGHHTGFLYRVVVGTATRPKSALLKGSNYIFRMQHHTRFLYLVAFGIATRPKSVLHQVSYTSICSSSRSPTEVKTTSKHKRRR